MTPCAVTCCKQCSLPVNNNKTTLIIHYKGEILTDMTIKLAQVVTGYDSLHKMELLSVQCLQVDYIVALLKTTTSIDFIHSSKSSATKQIFENHTYQNHSTLQVTMDYIINL